MRRTKRVGDGGIPAAGKFKVPIPSELKTQKRKQVGAYVIAA